MRVLFTCIALLFFAFSSRCQTFNGAGGNIPNLATTQTCFNANVTGVGVINGTYGLASVCMNISHADVGDLEIVLRGPDGTVVPLTMQNGGSGNNFNTTCFTATATTPIKFGTAPFNGSFLPEGHLGAVNNGQNANGSWSLCILDRRNNSGTGTVNSWSLSFANTPSPVPPALPACANTLPSSSSCATATLVCDFNGQCGSTAAPSVQTWPALTAASCFSLQNNSFVKFIASATTASFSVWIPTTIRPNYLDGGLQMLFFSAACNGPVTTYGCYEHIYPNSGTGQPTISVISASGLTPGNTYYLMIDGYNGDNCTFTIAANTGVNILDVTPANPAVCTGGSIDLTATGGNGIYSWSPPTGLNTTTGATVRSTPAGNITYTVTSTTAAGCPISKPVTVTVNPLPATPVASVTVQPTCTQPTGTIVITSPPTGSGVEYSVGGSLQSSPVFPNLTPGQYIVFVRNPLTSCSSPGVPLTVNPLPVAPAAPTATVTTSPTCTVNTGTITITAPIGAGFEYSINGTTYQAGTVFAGLAPGPYNVTVRNIATGCVSPANNLTVNALPAPPAAPFIFSITNPASCLISTGQFTVGSPTGSQYEYSIVGNAWQTSPVFNNVLPGSYQVVVRDISTGCVSASTPVTISPAPPLPQPVVNPVQPGCSNATGTVTITSPLGATIQYSIRDLTTNILTGPQASPVFNNVLPGSYVVTAQSLVNSCVGTSNFTINPAPIVPAAPTASVTTPATCTTPTGTITITAPLGAGLEYSVNGTVYQSSPTFNNLPPAGYNVTVRNAANGCSSAATPVTINVPPTFPTAPTGSVTAQPTCTAAGTITITAPVGNIYEYSLSGGAYQASPVFNNVDPGSYFVTVRNTVSGCLSTQLPLTVNAAPATPARPTFSIAQPTCTNTRGVISVIAPLGAGLEYNLDGGTFQASPDFTVPIYGSFDIRVRNIGTGCVSQVGIAQVTAPPPAISKPVVNVIEPACPDLTATLVVTDPVSADMEYSINGITYQSSNKFTNIAAGSFNITARLRGGVSCTSAQTNVLVKGLTPDQCPSGPDIYFPSAFTPNGDAVNEGFGPGPRTNLANVTNYTLSVFNRYGELVFTTTNPLLQWNGTFKGKMLANNSYTWVASYRYNGRVLQVKKGTVTIIR